MNKKLFGTAACATALLVFSTHFGWAQSDNADNDPYPVSGFLPGDNGGSGFIGWAELEEGDPGSMYLASSIESDSYSWGLSGFYGLGRGLQSARSSGRWTLIAQHDPDNSAFSGFSLRTSTNITSGFDTDEILRFGMDPGQAGYDGSGIYVSTNQGTSYQFLDCGWVDGEGDVIEYDINWFSSGTFSLSVSNRTEGVATTLQGSMEGGSVAMLGAASMNSTLNEGVIFDGFAVGDAVPEAGTAVSLLIGALVISFMRKRQ